VANIGRVLRDEIVRLCRREIRHQISGLQRVSRTHRRDIAALKRQQAALDRVAKELTKRLQKRIDPAKIESTAPLRFRADGFSALRKRLGLSAEQMGKLLGVSGQSVYAWEHKRSTPRRSQLPAIAAARSMGKREAIVRLATQGRKSLRP
jgi:DNA-binding transcriptional regulator YiaG